ncbi:MAG: TonB-dependent receptor [Bacteroidales bacterium]|nr:TonB-dependent receptor [Bacteroidales bacterium]
MKRITFVLALLLLCVGQLAYAQTIKVTGTVIDEATNEPVIAAGVMVKGTTNGVATDANGQYVINVRRDAVLVFSSVGYTTQEIPVNGRSVINVSLKADTETLEDVIVVGYGTGRKISTVVGSAQTVKAKALKDKPVINAADALQGQVAGLQVYTSSGDPSATVSMRIRGVNSLEASTTPLFVLDGTPVLSDIFNTLNPNDIESVTILKDASSTAIYGSRAANGVVYITTKKGTTEKPVVKLSANYGISNLARNPIKRVNSEEWFRLAEMVNPAYLTDADFQATKKFRLENNFNTNWMKWALNENVPTFGADLSVSGRTKVVDYYISMTANRMEGVEPMTAHNRYAARINMNVTPTDWFKFGIALGVGYQQSRENPYNSDYSSGNRNNWNNPVNFALWAPTWWTPYEILTDGAGNFTGFGEETPYMNDFGAYNPHYRYKYLKVKDNTVRLNGNLYEQITPIKGLTIRFAQGLEGYDYRWTRRDLQDPEDWIHIYHSDGPYVGQSFTRYYRLTSTNTAEYKFQLGQKHNITALVGQEAIINNSTGFSTSAYGMPDYRLGTLDNKDDTKPITASESWSQYKFNSLFTRLSYDYNAKYYVDLSFRRDGSSLFGANKRYANFWSAGAMWNIKAEKFLKDVQWIDKLQLSANYGTVGNSGISNYLSHATVATGTTYKGTTYYINNSGNENLTWETLESLNVALDFRLWNKLEAKVEWYRKMTKDMLLEIPWSYSTGFSGGYGNIGNMKNQGVEATITYDWIRNENMFLQTSLNVSYNKDKITSLFDGRDEFQLPDYGLNYKVGHSAGELWYVKSAGIDPATGRPLWYDKDGNITDVYSDDNRVLLGKSRYAPWSAGLQIDFTYKNFALQAQFSGIFGKYLINNDRYFYTNSNFADNRLASELLTEMWTTPGQKAKYPNPLYVVNDECFDSRLVENASFVRLKGVTLSYSLGKNALNKLGGVLTGVRFFVTGRNLLTWTKYSGWDPEQNINLQLAVYPNSKQYAAGVELTF